MNQRKPNLRIGIRTFILISAVCSVLTGCIHSPNNESIYTQAAITIAAELTSTALAWSPTPPPTDTPLPTETPAPTQEPMVLPTMPVQIDVPLSEQTTPTTVMAENPYKAEVASISPFPNQFLPGQKFTWTISLKNIGSTTWSGKYGFSYSKGVQLANSSSVQIDTVTPPGGILTLNLPATAPDQLGTHQSEWKLTRPDGVAFFYIYYNAIVGDTTFITSEPNAPATQTPNTLEWMCSDAGRSNIQQAGCEEFCRTNAAVMLSKGKPCYSYGNQIMP